MANTEDIEAKLCAYVDGELDAAGVAEIERHLTTNPQHARLIAELTETRDMLRALPHERAPIDILETIQGQLERSVLLDESTADAASLRISQWSQLRAIAAVLVLAVGLAAVLYFVLPSPNPPPREFAVNANSPELAVDSTPTADELLNLNPGVTPRVLVGNGKPDDANRMGKGGAPSAPSPHREWITLGNAVVPLDSLTNAIPPDHDIFAAALGSPGMKQGGGAGAAELRVVVRATDIADARTRVRTYLDNNRVTYHESAPESQLPIPLAIGPTQVAMGGKMYQRAVVIKSGPTTASSDVPNEPKQDQPTHAFPFAKSSGSTDGGPNSTVQLTVARVSEDAVTIACQMRRGDVDTMCNAITDRIAGRLARIDETASSASDIAVEQAISPPDQKDAQRQQLDRDDEVVNIRIVLVTDTDQADPTSQPTTAPDSIPAVK